MLSDPFSRPHKEKREKAVWQRETRKTLLNNYYNYYNINSVSLIEVERWTSECWSFPYKIEITNIHTCHPITTHIKLLKNLWMSYTHTNFW